MKISLHPVVIELTTKSGDFSPVTSSAITTSHCSIHIGDTDCFYNIVMSACYLYFNKLCPGIDGEPACG